MRVLVIAPHPDDEVLGVGGTIAKHLAKGDEVSICIATKGVKPLFDDISVGKVKSEAIKAHELLGTNKTYFLDLPAVMLEQIPRHEINEKISSTIYEVMPDILYIPHFGDMQKDHQIIAEAVMVAVRPKFAHRVKEVYAYETLSETEWNNPHSANAFMPNVYNDVSNYLEAKINAMKCYESQLSDFPNPRSIEAIKALAKYRGSTVNAEAAEALVLIRKIII